MISDRSPAAITPISVRRYDANGPLVVLLHGGPGAPGEMAPVAERLKDRFAVIEPFQRKSGDVPLTVERHVLDLHDALNAVIRGGSVRIVGFSWGAMLGLTYAARFPESVHSLILIGCGTYDKKSRRVYEMNMEKKMSPEIQARINQINDRLAFEKNRDRRNLLFAEFGAIYTRLQSFDAVTDISQNVLDYDEAGFRETWEDVLSLQEKGIQPAEFAQITSPVVMIHGEEDPHPGSMIHEALNAFVQNLTYISMPQCGHKPWMEHLARDQFFDLLCDNLQ